MFLLQRCWMCGALAEYDDDAPWGPDYVCKEHHADTATHSQG